MKNIVVLLILVMTVSCISNNTRNSQVFSFIPDVFPYTDTIYAKHLNDMPFYTFGQQNLPKIIFFIGNDCSACFAQITKWQNYIEKNRALFHGIAKAIVIQTEQLEMLEYNLEKINNSLPIYIDTSKCFSTYNNLGEINVPNIITMDKENRHLYTTTIKEIENKNILLKQLKIINHLTH